MAHITIQLVVDTVEILKAPRNTRVNLNRVCTFKEQPDKGEDFNEQPKWQRIKKFKVRAKPGDTIEWEGVPESGSHHVNITSINYEDGNELFGQDILLGSGTPEKVLSPAIQGVPGMMEKYSLHFTITNGNNECLGTYFIDPKIRVH